MPIIYAHKQALRSLFQNLFSNAIKSQSPNIKPQRSIKYSNLREFPHFEIRDNGIGIKSDYMEKYSTFFSAYIIELSTLAPV